MTPIASKRSTSSEAWSVGRLANSVSPSPGSIAASAASVPWERRQKLRDTASSTWSEEPMPIQNFRSRLRALAMVPASGFRLGKAAA